METKQLEDHAPLYQKNENVGDMGIDQILPIKELRVHENSVDDIAANPKTDKEFVSGSHDHTIKLWDATKFTCKATLKGHTEGIWSIQYDRPTGTKLISGSCDTSVKIWDAKSGKCIDTLKGHKGYVYKACFDNYGENVASVGADNALNFWDLRKTKTPVFKIQDDTNDVLMGVDFMPNDQQILTTSMDGNIQIVSVKRQQRVFYHETLPPIIDAKIDFAMKSDPDNINVRRIRKETHNILFNVMTVKELPEEENVFIVGQEDGSALKIRSSLDKLDIVDKFFGHSMAVRNMSMNKDGSQLLTCCQDHSLRIWDYKTCEAKKILAGHQDICTGGAWLNNSTIVSSSWDMRIMAWRI